MIQTKFFFPSIGSLHVKINEIVGTGDQIVQLIYKAVQVTWLYMIQNLASSPASVQH